MDFIMASFFTAFFYGLLYPAIEFLEERFNLRLLRAIATSILALIPTYVLGVRNGTFVIFSFGVAFCGLSLVTVVQRVATSTPTIIRAVGQD
jgi:hypothetical protein